MEIECPLCHQRAEIVPNAHDHRNISYIECGTCGNYAITGKARKFLPEYYKDDPILYKRLQRYLWENRDEKCLISADTMPVDCNWSGPKLSLDETHELYKDDGSPLQMFNAAIKNLADNTEKIGQSFDLKTKRWMIPTLDDDEARAIIHELAENKLVSILTETKDGHLIFSITSIGLAYAEELGKQNEGERKIGFRNND